MSHSNDNWMIFIFKIGVVDLNVRFLQLTYSCANTK